MGKIAQNPKIGQLWRPVAPQSYVVEKSYRLRKLPGPWTTTWSKQYLSAVHPMTCNLLWVRFLFDRFSISDVGGKWPLKWKFSKISFRIPQRWKSAVAKLPKGHMVYQTKKLALRGTRPSPDFSQTGPIAPKIPWTLSPLDISKYTEFGPDRLRFAGLIPERLIFRPKKSIQI